MRLFGGTVRCSAISHAIPPEYVAGLYHFMLLSHSCLGIACGFGEGRVWVQREGCVWGRIEVWLWVHWGCGWGCIWGAPGVYLGSTGVDGTEVPCIRRWEEVWAEGDDRVTGFRCDA